jgi:hypothetical protein
MEQLYYRTRRATTFFAVSLESLTFFGVSVEYFGVFQRLLGLFVLISFRRYAGILISIKQRVCFSFHAIQERFSRWIKPRTTSFLLGTFADMTRGKAELLAENALLRHQLVILRRHIKRPVYRKRDRLLLVLLTRMVRTWEQALFLVQPETLLRWHRELFRVFWKLTSKAHARKPRLSLETITLIKEMAAHNRRLPGGAHSWRAAQAGYSGE